MKIEATAEVVEGITMREFRDFFKRSSDYVGSTDQAETFCKTKAEARKLAGSLIAAGYLEKADNHGSYPLSQKGMQLANAKFMKRMSRTQGCTTVSRKSCNS